MFRVEKACPILSGDKRLSVEHTSYDHVVGLHTDFVVHGSAHNYESCFSWGAEQSMGIASLKQKWDNKQENGSLPSNAKDCLPNNIPSTPCLQ